MLSSITVTVKVTKKGLKEYYENVLDRPLTKAECKELVTTERVKAVEKWLNKNLKGYFDEEVGSNALELLSTVYATEKLLKIPEE